MKQIDNYSQMLSWAKLWFQGKPCQEMPRETDIRSRRYYQDTIQQEQQLILRLTFQKFKLFKMASLRHLIQIQNLWKRLNQATTHTNRLLLLERRSKKKLHTTHNKRKSFASSTIVYTNIQHNSHHILIQILPIEHQLLFKQALMDDDDDIPLGNLIK